MSMSDINSPVSSVAGLQRWRGSRLQVNGPHPRRGVRRNCGNQEDQGELGAAQERLACAAVHPGGATAALQVTSHITWWTNRMITVPGRNPVQSSNLVHIFELLESTQIGVDSKVLTNYWPQPDQLDLTLKPCTWCQLALTPWAQQSAQDLSLCANTKIAISPIKDHAFLNIGQGLRRCLKAYLGKII